MRTGTPRAREPGAPCRVLGAARAVGQARLHHGGLRRAPGRAWWATHVSSRWGIQCRMDTDDLRARISENVYLQHKRFWKDG